LKPGLECRRLALGAAARWTWYCVADPNQKYLNFEIWKKVSGSGFRILSAEP
jgi:hypothetical protein